MELPEVLPVMSVHVPAAHTIAAQLESTQSVASMHARAVVGGEAARSDRAGGPAEHTRDGQLTSTGARGLSTLAKTLLELDPTKPEPSPVSTGC